MDYDQDKNRKKGLITSIVVHLALILIFAFFGMSYTIPPPEEEGITINFGFTDAGSGDVQASSPEQPVEETVEEQVEESSQETATEEILEQSVEESAAIPKEEKQEEKKEEEKPVEKEPEPQPDKNLSDALNKWKSNKDQSSSGDGTTNQQGDQGRQDGDPNSNNYIGGGSGNGTEYNLSGRSMVSSPKIQDNSQDEGKVVVTIIVDKNGRVLRAEPGARGSTTTSPILYKKAKEAALKTKFNANPNAAEEQKGTMTFIFILN
ncbi:MAG: energy transducer TonB [Flavobacteriales bacterium]|nr:energy transducer TonB [Flavobacteriales bacterium]